MSFSHFSFIALSALMLFSACNKEEDDSLTTPPNETRFTATLSEGTNFTGTSGSFQDARGIQSLTMNGKTLIFTTDFAGFIHVSTVDKNGTLQSLSKTATLGNVKALTLAQVGNEHFVVAGSDNTNSLEVYKVLTDGSLSMTDDIRDNSFVYLNNINSIAAVTVFGKTYIAAIGVDDRGLSVFSLDAQGQLANADSYTLSNTKPLQVRIAEIYGTAYILVTTISDQVIFFDLSSTGRLSKLNTHTGSVVVGGSVSYGDLAIPFVQNDSLHFVHAQPRSSSFTFGFEDYNGPVSTWKFMEDDNSIAIQNVIADIKTINDRIFLATVCKNENILSIFELLPSQNNVILRSTLDGQTVAGLDTPRAIAFVEAEGEHFVAVTSQTDQTLTLFNLD